MAQPTVTILNGNNAAATMGVYADAAGNNYPAVQLDSGIAHYACSALFTPFATAPVTYISIVGSSTMVVRVKAVAMWMVATANASVGLTLARGTALGTGGTAVSPTITKYDSTNAAATAVVKHYTTAAQSAATGSTNLATINLTGNLVAETVQIFAPAAVSFIHPLLPSGQSMVLRTTSEILEVQANLGQSGGANGPPAMQMGYTVIWSEAAA